MQSVFATIKIFVSAVNLYRCVLLNCLSVLYFSRARLVLLILLNSDFFVSGSAGCHISWDMTGCTVVANNHSCYFWADLQKAENAREDGVLSAQSQVQMEESAPKMLTIEVLSSQSRVAVSVDGAMVSI